MQGLEAVGFLDAQVPDVLDPGRTIGEERDHGVDEGGVGEGVHVHLAQAAERAIRAPDLDAVGLANDFAAHLLEQTEHPEIRLQGIGRDAFDAHRSARDGGGAEGVGGRRGVGFDRVGACAVGDARPYPDAFPRGARPFVVHPIRLGPEIAHDGQGGLHVGTRDEFAFHEREVDILSRVGGGQQNRRGELARVAAVDEALASGQTASGDMDRRTARFALDAQLGAEARQGVDQVGDGPLAHARAAVDDHGSRGQASGGGEEARGGPRVLAIERPIGFAQSAAGAHHRPGVAPDIELCAQGGQGIAHDIGVVARQGAGQGGFTFGERGDEKGAVGDALGSRDADAGVEGAAGLEG